MKETEQNKKDIEVLKALYYGNHLNDKEMERALWLLHIMSRELEQRVK
jgi:hypothetical protein